MRSKLPVISCIIVVVCVSVGRREAGGGGQQQRSTRIPDQPNATLTDNGLVRSQKDRQ